MHRALIVSASFLCLLMGITLMNPVPALAGGDGPGERAPTAPVASPEEAAPALEEGSDAVGEPILEEPPVTPLATPVGCITDPMIILDCDAICGCQGKQVCRCNLLTLECRWTCICAC